MCRSQNSPTPALYMGLAYSKDVSDHLGTGSNPDINTNNSYEVNAFQEQVINDHTEITYNLNYKIVMHFQKRILRERLH